MKLVRFAVNRPVTIAILVCLAIILGAVSLARLAVDLYPDIKLPVAAVITSYTGAGPEEVESQVTQPLEETLGTLGNIKNIESYSQAGNSIVVIWFNWGTNMEAATQDMRDKIAIIEKYLPDGTDKPMVVKMDPSMAPILQMGISGDQDLSSLQALAEDTIKPRLERIDGVASVVITGGKTREVQVEVDPARIEQYGLSIGQVAQALMAENFNQSSGTVEAGGKQYYVRSLQEFESLDDIRNVEVMTASGTPVRIGDIADVKGGFKDVEQLTRVDGRSSIGVHVLKQSDANTVKVTEKVKAELAKLEKELPGNVKVGIMFDQSKFINESINTVKRSIIEGALLAMLIIFLFLRNARSTLIIFTAIPLSIITTFVLMYFSKMTLNLISLGGVALGVGRMVDDSIVVLESIFRHRRQGKDPKEAAVTGATEVGKAVMAATFTTVAVFLPIVYVTGIAAIIFKPLAMTVSFAILSSLIVSLTIVPLLSSRMLTRDLMAELAEEEEGSAAAQKGFKRLARRFGAWIDGLGAWYRGVIHWALSHRRRVVVIVTLLMVVSFALTPLVGAEFMPSADEGQISVSIQMDKGAVLDKTDQVTREVESRVKKYPEVATIFTSVGPADNYMISGSGQTDTATLMVVLKDKGKRSRSTDEVAEAMRRDVAGIPGARITVKPSSMTQEMGMSSAPVNIQIKGDDIATLQSLSNQVADIVRTTPGTREVDSSLTEGKPEVQIKVDRQKAAAYGLTPATVASTLKMAVAGQTVTKYRVGGDEVDVTVRYVPSSRADLARLGSISIATPAGSRVPLGELASFTLARGPMTVHRYDQVRTADVTAQLSGRDLKSVTRDIQARIDKLTLPSGYSIEFAGQNEQMTDSFKSLSIALLLAIILVYAVMAVQYESFFDPFVIMFSVPTCFIGIVFALAATRKSFSVVAFIGAIMLVGIAVSNAIVLVDYIKQLRARGVPRNEAIAEAGAVRIRPILMTALATILGLLPLALGLGQGGESQSPMAITVIGGLLASTAITLVLVPVVYTIFDDWGQKIGRKRRVRRGLEDEAVSLQ